MLAKPLNIIISIIAANILGPEEKGVAAWIIVLISIAAYVFSFGCGSAIRFLLAGRSETLKHLAWTSIAVGFLNGTVGSVVIATLAYNDMLGLLTKAIPETTKWAILVLIPVMVVESVLNRALIGEARYKFINLLELASALFYPLLLVLFVIFFDWGLLGANLAFFITRGTCLVGTLIYVFREYTPIWRFDWDICLRSYTYGLRVWLGGMTVFLNMYLDSLFVGWSMPAATMGSYSIAVTIARSVMILPQAVNIVLTNRLIGLERHQAIQETALLHRSTFWVVILASIVLGGIGYVLLPLAMPEFKETPSVFLILLLGSICSASFTILNSFFASQGMPGRSSIAQVVGFLLGGFVTPFLVWKWSGIGGAIGSSLIYFIIAVIMWFFFWWQNSNVAVRAFEFRLADWNWIVGQIKAATGLLRRTPSC